MTLHAAWFWCAQHVTSIAKNYSRAITISGKQKTRIPIAVSTTITLNSGTSSERLTIFYTK
jgi:hypothetical protein